MCDELKWVEEALRAFREMGLQSAVLDLALAERMLDLAKQAAGQDLSTAPVRALSPHPPSACGAPIARRARRIDGPVLRPRVDETAAPQESHV